MSRPLFTRAQRSDNGQWAVSYYGNSHLGTPEVAFEKSGEVTWRARAQAFGETQVTLNTIDNPLRFPGQYFDAESGLHYNYFRDYDPALGRYVENDPIGLRGGLNFYAYVNANPSRFIDPTGQVLVIPLLCAAGGCEALVAAAAYVGTAIIGAIAGVYIAGRAAEDGEDSDSSENCHVDKKRPPNHPDFVPDKKKKDLDKIPWDKNRKGYKDKSGNYWEPVPDGHKGTHDPHWDVQHPDGSHTPVYPDKK